MITFKQQSSSYVPRSYQEVGISLGVSQASAAMLMAPGLGKTSIAYAIFSILQNAGFVKKMLVICPLKPAYNVWPSQKDKYTEFKHLRVCVLHGKNKEELLKSDDYDIYVVNPEGLDWLFGPVVKHAPSPSRFKLVREKFQMLWVDESHKFKDTGTNRFKLMRNIVPAFKRRYIGTGTFNPEGLEDLFGQVYLLDEGVSLGRYITHYRGKYFHQKPYDIYTYYPNHGAAEEIAAKIAPYSLVAGRDLVPDLPKLMFDDRLIDLPPAARKAYDQAEFDLLVKLEAGDIVAANAAVASSKCRQIANGFVYGNEGQVTRLHTEKLEDLKALIEEMAGQPLIVTYEFIEDHDILISELKVPSISTGNAKKDNETIERFRRGAYPVVIGSTASISLGIDGLQDICGHLYMYGVTWRVTDYIQVIDRIRRSGNKHSNVIIHRCLARDTVDERVVAKLDVRETDMIDFMAILKGLRSGE